MRSQIPCKTCETGHLAKRKKYRMSGVVVLIGYILLVPSLLGIAGATMGVVATGSATTQVTDSMQREAQEKLRSAGVSAKLVEKVANHETVIAEELGQLTDAQRRVVRQVELELSAKTVGAGAGVALAGGASFLLGVLSLVGGLLGWLLVMKKTVLQCNSCGAVVAAS